MKYSTRELAVLAVFGAVWGLVEISLGSVLKALDVPLSGMILAALGLLIALIGRIYVPKKGSTLFIGVIAMLLKLFSMGGIIIGPMVAILVEALVAEAALSAFGKPSRLAFATAGALAVTWTLVQPFVTGPLLFGRAMVDIWLRFIEDGAALLGLAPEVALWIAAGLLAIYLTAGALVGLMGWGLAGQLAKRTGNTAPAALQN